MTGRDCEIETACASPLPPKIILQQTEQQVILPRAVDAQVSPRQPLAREAAFFQHADRRRVGRDAGRLDAVYLASTHFVNTMRQ